MVGSHIRRELRRPLEGPRNFISLQRGGFTIREDPTHVAESISGIIRRRQLEEAEARIRSVRLMHILNMMS